MKIHFYYSTGLYRSALTDHQAYTDPFLVHIKSIHTYPLLLHFRPTEIPSYYSSGLHRPTLIANQVCTGLHRSALTTHYAFTEVHTKFCSYNTGLQRSILATHQAYTDSHLQYCTLCKDPLLHYHNGSHIYAILLIRPTQVNPNYTSGLNRSTLTTHQTYTGQP